VSQQRRDEEAAIMDTVARWLWLALLGAVAAVWCWTLLHAGFNVG
jgi:hypothetical protein